MVTKSRGGDGLTVKRLEKLALAAEQRLNERLAAAKESRRHLRGGWPSACAR